MFNFIDELGNASKLCEIMEFSPDTFYRGQSVLMMMVQGSVRAYAPQPDLKKRVDEKIGKPIFPFAAR